MQAVIGKRGTVSCGAPCVASTPVRDWSEAIDWATQWIQRNVDKPKPRRILGIQVPNEVDYYLETLSAGDHQENVMRLGR